MKIKRSIMLIIIALILSISFSVNAATGDSYKISLSANKTTLKEEETLTLTMKASDIKIQSGEKGIGSYEGTLVYDESIFEEVKMKGNSNWDATVLNQGKFTSVRSDALCTSEDQEIAVITLKVKKGAKTGQTKIQIKDFEASNGLTNVTNNGTEIEIKIEKTDNNTEKPGNTGDTDNKGDNGNNGSTGNAGNTGNLGGTSGSGNSSNSGNSGSGTNASKNPTTSQTTNSKNNASTTKQNGSKNKGSLPYTGISDVMIIIILGVASVGVFCYIKYKRTGI